MADRIVVNGVDVSSYKIAWSHEEMWREAIPSMTIEFRLSFPSEMPISTAMSIQVYRTINTADDDFVFDGEITQVKTQPDKIICECKGRLIEAIKAVQTRSWDKDIDPEAGIGSEIMKTLIINSNLNCTPAQYDTTTVGSIFFTGSDTENLITKFIQRDEDNYDRMNLIADQYDCILRYNNVDSLIYFQPKGYSVYPYTLTVGVEIPKSIVWKENKEQLVNKVIVSGATVYDTVVETFGGPATSFTLQKTPEDTEVRVGGSGGTLQTRGTKGVGTLGVNHTYEIDTESKTLTFASAQSNVYIKYSTQVPCPVVLTNQTSIDTYGGPNKTPSVKKLSYTDLKNLADAEARGRSVIDKYSTPFLEAQGVKISEQQTRLQVVKPGDLLHIVDPQAKKDVHVFVQAVRKTSPQPLDEIDIGDKIWRTETWQADQMKKINQIFNDLNKNQNIITQIFDFSDSVSFEPMYTAVYKGDRSASNTLIWDSPVKGIWDTGLWGPDTLPETLEIMIPGNNEFKEYFYSTEFIDLANTSATINTTDWRVE